ncbi:uroporphyrinogen III synthase [Methylobacterium sp. Leaf399]|uniref:uroporphyrinogen-III synthase n=1 Tax=Methylobacterium sp. Leaf399 TaxID=1736364 RepID=UPI0006F6F6CE|nr:uroporphyrinogen-III synthase [Methylobacterium sp. Leaf399]KQT11896.1 uroporphyrinogen III synthase [Methylobacterium sp. Leaf399]
MRVWIARPEPGASRTAARVSALGHDPLVAPVLMLATTGDAPPDGRFDGLVVTSASAILALPGPALPGDGTTPVFCVGGRTAQAARDRGFRSVLDAGGDAADLVRLVAATLRPPCRLLHLAGAERKAEPGLSLERAGYAVAIHVSYGMTAAAALPAPVATALAEGQGEPVAAALHYSRRSAEVALALAISAGRGGAFRALKHYCLSADVAAPLVAAGGRIHFIAARPSEDDLLAGLANDV